MIRWFWLGLAAVAWAGCDSLRGPHQQVVLPEVRGRVVDAATGGPLSGARLERLSANRRSKDPLDQHAAERQMAPTPIRTDADGRFLFGEVRSGNLLFERAPVYVFTLTARQAGYLPLSTNIDLLKLRPVKRDGVLTVDVGDLRLERKAE